MKHPVRCYSRAVGADGLITDFLVSFAEEKFGIGEVWYNLNEVGPGQVVRAACNDSVCALRRIYTSVCALGPTSALA